MKAILEFTLPEEQDDHEVAVNGMKYLCVLQEFDNWLRAELKYNGAGREVQRVRDQLHAMLNSREISLWQ